MNSQGVSSSGDGSDLFLSLALVASSSAEITTSSFQDNTKCAHFPPISNHRDIHQAYEQNAFSLIFADSWKKALSSTNTLIYMHVRTNPGVT